MQQQATSKLLTVRETASRLRQSEWTVRAKIAEGELPAIRLGSGPRAPLRVDASDLDRWLEANQTTARAFESSWGRRAETPEDATGSKLSGESTRPAPRGREAAA